MINRVVSILYKSQYEKAKGLDNTLLRCKGNEEIKWWEIQTRHEEIEQYYHIENWLKQLIGEGLLRQCTFRRTNTFCLTPKGWAVLADIKHEGYLARFYRQKRKHFWNIAVGASTFIILFFTFIDHCSMRKVSQSMQQQEVSPAPIKLISSPDTLHSDSLLHQQLRPKEIDTIEDKKSRPDTISAKP